MATKMLIFCGSDEPEKAFPRFMLGSAVLPLRRRGSALDEPLERPHQ
jgi:hypothetical protein